MWILRTLSVLVASTAAGQYVGSEACRGCHPANFKTQSTSGHARALARAPAGSPGEWAFGAGAKAITYVSRVDSDWYVEHGLSYYPARKSTGLTPGHNDSKGRRYRTFDPLATTLRCFRCHSTGPLKLGEGRQIEPAEHGVRCESCHGPGLAHVNSAHVKQAGAAGSILNPKQLGASELNEFCGSCHRKAEDISDWSNSWNVRHQPAYLSQAACFRKAEGKLSCLTCHDPHAPLNQAAAGYDKRCASCHRGVKHSAPVAARSCVGCHMPQVQTNADLRFTNHWIGIYRKGSTLVPVRRAGKALPPVTTARLDTRFTPPADPSSFRALYEQVLTEQEQELGPKHAKVARSASDLGLFLKSIGDFSAALAPLQKALDIDRQNGDGSIPADQENLASIYGALSRPDQAFPLLQQAAEGSDSAVSARSFTTLAALDPANAETYYRKALRAEEAASGENHFRVAAILNNLGLVLQQKNDSQAAEALFRRALVVQQQALGADHPATALTRNNLGSLLHSTGRLAEAERVERAAVRILEQKLGPETIELAAACTNLADLLVTKGSTLEAEKLLRRALSIDESIYGPDHPEVAGDLSNLAMLLRDTGKAAQAEPLLRRALAIYEKQLGPNSPQAIQLRQSMKR